MYKYLLCDHIFYSSAPHANAGPPKKRHKGWSPESSANNLPESTVKTPPSSSTLSTLSVSPVITNGARSGEKEEKRQRQKKDEWRNK